MRGLYCMLYLLYIRIYTHLGEMKQLLGQHTPNEMTKEN